MFEYFRKQTILSLTRKITISSAINQMIKNRFNIRPKVCSMGKIPTETCHTKILVECQRFKLVVE